MEIAYYAYTQQIKNIIKICYQLANKNSISLSDLTELSFITYLTFFLNISFRCIVNNFY